MIEVRQTDEFEQWIEGLNDQIAQKRIGQRIARLEVGLFGDTKSVGDKVHELRIDHGPGYRVYFKREGRTVLLLLCGGDKSTQKQDIERAKEIAAKLE